MTKKVLVISSSPRKGGNSDTLADEFVRGAIDSGNIAQKIFLKDKKINYCTGCGCCNKNGYTACSQKDDMDDILSEMVDSDVIVMATPVYFYSMCGQMKTFIDRCCSRYTKILNKDFYFIVTAADGRETAMKRTIEEFRGFLACLENATEKAVLNGVGVWNIGEIKDSGHCEKAYSLGKHV